MYNHGTAIPSLQAGPLVSVYAQGAGVAVSADDGSVDQYTGTSIAAAAISGLAAYFLSLDKWQECLSEGGTYSANMESLLKDFAYDRSGDVGGPPVAFNGLYWTSCKPQGLGKRDDGTNGACGTHYNFLFQKISFALQQRVSALADWRVSISNTELTNLVSHSQP